MGERTGSTWCLEADDVVARAVDTRAEQAAPEPGPRGRSSSYGFDWTHEVGCSVLHAVTTADATVCESAGCDLRLLVPPACRPEGGPGGASKWMACSAVGWRVDDVTQS